MTDFLSPTVLQDEINRLASLLNEKQAELELWTERWARAERDYRKARRTAWVGIQSHKMTVPEKEAEVDGITADERFARDLAEGNKATLTEAIRSLRANLSAVQTLGAIMRTDMEMAR